MKWSRGTTHPDERLRIPGRGCFGGVRPLVPPAASGRLTTRTTTMVRDPFADDAPDLQDVLDALDDRDCRTIVEALDEPMTANELSDACDIPLSTAYRKLDLLSEASLLEERVELRSDGRHTTKYALAFDEVRIALAVDRSLDVAIRRRAQTPDERLSELWSEVRTET